MYELIFNPLTHTICNMLFLFSLVYGLSILVLVFFKRKLLLKRIIPECIAKDDAGGIFSFLFIVVGLMSIVDLFLEYPSDHETFLSVTMFLALGSMAAFCFAIDGVIKLHQSIPEE